MVLSGLVIIITTLLFFSLPSSVLLSASGLDSPKLSIDMTASATPLSARYFLADSALFLDSSKLLSGDPTESVCPSSVSFQVVSFLRSSANLSRLSKLSGFMSNLLVSKLRFLKAAIAISSGGVEAVAAIFSSTAGGAAGAGPGLAACGRLAAARGG